MTTPGDKLANLIKKAIANLELTTSDYEAILVQADEDKVIDAEERALLKQLQEKLANGSIKRVP